MAKTNRQQPAKPKTQRRQHSQVMHGATAKSGSNGVIKPSQAKQGNQLPKVPFMRKDRVLLIGEGDMSFALSLIQHHKPKAVIATCYDSQTELLSKYPKITETIVQLDASAVVPSSRETGLLEVRSAETRAPHQDQGQEDVFEGFSPSPSPSPPAPLQTTTSTNTSPTEHQSQRLSSFSKTQTRVLYSIDATKLSTPQHLKLLRPLGPFTKIVFNFPHVGGLSTDVNRQVRSNQELLVKFLDAAKPLLNASFNTSKKPDTTRPQKRSERYSTPPSSEDDEAVFADEADSETARHQPANGTRIPQILITLFTSHPYTLWNIRDLARHTGYIIRESFRFPWEAYPGYHHARTVGDIVSKHEKDGDAVRQRTNRGSEGNGKEGKDGTKKNGKGRWFGDDREARTYVLELKEHQDVPAAPLMADDGDNPNLMAVKPRGKRKRGGVDSDGKSD